jgi:hypothetical protein
MGILVKKTNKGLLNRGNLRDLIIVISAASALAWDVDGIRTGIAFLILATGCALHFITKGVLIRNVVLCKDGLYKIVRHPYYMANYLIDSSFCLLSGNVYLLLLYPFLFFWAYGPSLRREEKGLASSYGDAYSRYCLESPQVFPDADSIENWRSLLRGFSKKRIAINEWVRLMRFWAVAFFLALVQDLTKEGLGELMFLSHPTDHDALMYLAMGMSLLSVSFLVIRMKKKG